MYLSWRERLNVQPDLRDISSWPVILGNELPYSKRKSYFRNRKAIASVLAGNSIKKAATEANLSSPRVSQLLRRCLSGDEYKMPPLTKALVPGYQIKRGKRRIPVSSITNMVGARGSFNHLLDNVPGLKERLNKVIVASVKRVSYGQNLTPAAFHAEFLRLLVELGWSKNKYPFDQDKMGYESCRKYFHRCMAELRMPKAKSTRQITVKRLVKRAYQEIQIDSQVVDVNMSIAVEINGQQIPTRISRVSLFLAIDVATQCILAHHLCITKDPTQTDLLTLLENIHRPWQPLNLKTPGLVYEPGSCLPSSLGEIHEHAGIGILRLDNALCHMSHLVRDYVTGTLESTLNFGLPAHPKGRNFIEYAFRRLNIYTHRFPSTTGSHPLDSIKETKNNFKKPPLLTLTTFEEILSVFITAYNIKPQERLGGLAPLEIMKNMMKTEFCRISFSCLDKKPNAFMKREYLIVRCLKQENARPHINFQGLRYKGDCLAEPALDGKKVCIDYDIRDIRCLTVSKSDGTVLGKVNAPKTWQNYPCSIQTKKRISKYSNKSRMRQGDPLSGYFVLICIKN